jgi:hypothetical protein
LGQRDCIQIEGGHLQVIGSRARPLGQRSCVHIARGLVAGLATRASKKCQCQRCLRVWPDAHLGTRNRAKPPAPQRRYWRSRWQQGSWNMGTSL